MSKGLRIIAVIPARGGSKGIPNKNLQKIGELTLVEWTIRAALKSEIVSRVIVTSDSTKILSVASEFVRNSFPSSAQKVEFHNRSKALASDTSKIMDTLKEVVNLYSISENNCDAILMLQPTSPLRKRGEIDHFLEFATNSGRVVPAVSVRAVCDGHPARMYFRDNEDILVHCNFLREEEFLPRQELTQLYLRDGCYYLMSLNMISKGTPVMEKSKAFIRDYPFNLNIDESSDLELSRIEYCKVINDI
jgi:CMP-N,N'-diacetyllegionaminic acid synthase